jgi:chromate reductase
LAASAPTITCAQSLVFLNMPPLQEEAYIGQAASLFDEQGKLSKPDTREFVGKFLGAFDRWIELLSRAR